MALSPQHGRCPSFPAAFHIRTSDDLLLPVDGVTLFFRENKMNTGHYTLMWSMAKVMLKIAQSTVGGLDVWEEFLEEHRASQLTRMMDKYVGIEWDRRVI